MKRYFFKRNSQRCAMSRSKRENSQIARAKRRTIMNTRCIMQNHCGGQWHYRIFQSEGCVSTEKGQRASYHPIFVDFCIFFGLKMFRRRSIIIQYSIKIIHLQIWFFFLSDSKYPMWRHLTIIKHVITGHIWAEYLSRNRKIYDEVFKPPFMVYFYQTAHF